MHSRRGDPTRGRLGGSSRAVGPVTTLLVLGLASVTAGCRATVPIGHLLDDPYQFDGRKVKVEGKVVGAVGALGHGAYEIDDGTGSLLVVLERTRGGIPRVGAHVAVTGWYKSAFTVGPFSAGLLFENNRDLRRRRD